MEMREILEQQAGYVRASGVTVTVESRYPTVAIEGDGVDVFMQGEEAEAFLDDADQTWRKVGTLGLDVVYEALAAPYVGLE